jgi:hypothetical protein
MAYLTPHNGDCCFCHEDEQQRVCGRKVVGAARKLSIQIFALESLPSLNRECVRAGLTMKKGSGRMKRMEVTVVGTHRLRSIIKCAESG